MVRDCRDLANNSSDFNLNLVLVVFAESDSNKPYYSEVAACLMAKMGYDQSQGLGKNSKA